MRSIHTAAAVATAIFAATTVGGALAGGSSDGIEVLNLTAQTEQFAVIDVGTPGPVLGLGDQIISSDKVFRNGKAAGTDAVTCTVVKATAQTLTCNWVMTIALPEGLLTLQAMADGPTGPPSEPTKITFAVTGGTGRFRSAHGSADITDNPGGTEQIAVRLTR
ncbi:hypothetical protein EV643_110208 [Kribbella sp. VKM Ac-2527]|uniref:Allene oxide cyclase barrel-like domain-containing protein n=1 Tax=Kribbella caucasensis TaxID=2512215 RepID=A0A4R6KAJ0_9ACTN|nr:hypothetical protein [Kribbella sp. VKM Ac-2527]TDO46825.1 hypothetical protein EV643_110208 [Kribbella sp. VKM Ac-2527]